MKMTKTDGAFLRGLRGPKHWREADARRALGLYEASGQSRAAFARRHGLRASRLAWWERRLGVGSARPKHGSERTPTTRSSGFVELVVGADASPPCGAATVRVGSVVVELSALDAAAADFVVALCRATGSDACS